MTSSAQEIDQEIAQRVSPVTGEETPRTAQLRLDFARDSDGVTRLARRRVRYPYAFLKPFWFDDKPTGIATVLLQSVSGGLFGGEQLHQEFNLAQDCAVHVTNQGASVVHSASDRPGATQQVRLQLAEGAYLEYLPEPLILFPRSSLSQSVQATVSKNAVLVCADAVIRHDQFAHAEPFTLCRTSLEVHNPVGDLLFGDRSEVSGEGFDAVMQVRGEPWRGWALFTVIAPHQDLAALHAALDNALCQLDPQTTYAAVAALPFDAGVACRVVARRGDALRDALEVCRTTARLTLTGAPAPRRRK